MNRGAIASAGVAIAAVSFAMGRATVPSAPEAAVEGAKPIVFAPDQPANDPSEDALRACETKLALAEAVFRAQEHEKVGDPVPFPDDLPAQYRPEGFENAIRATLAACDGSGVELAHVDCSEFPCFAFFRPGAVSYGHQGDALWDCDAWREQFPSSMGGGNDVFMTDGGVVEYTYTSPIPEADAPAPFDENLGKRVALRATENKAQLMAEINGRELSQIEQLDLGIAMFREAGDEELVARLEAQRATLVAAQNASP